MKQRLGIRGAQTLPDARIDSDNVVESVQKLQDLLGAAKLGKASDDSVYVCGVLLRNTDQKLKELEDRIKALESKAEAKEDG